MTEEQTKQKETTIGKLQEEKSNIKSINNEIMDKEMECSIPCKTGDKHDNLIEGHIISQHRLKLLTSEEYNNKVIHWPTSLTWILTLATKQTIKDKSHKYPPGKKDIILGEYEPKEESIYDCTQKFVCGYHDNSAFKLADKNPGKFAPHNPQTQFELGFRSIVAYTNLIQRHKIYVLDKFPGMIEEAKKKPASQDLVQQMEYYNDLFKQEEFDLGIEEWVKAYMGSDFSDIISQVTSATPAIQIAGTGIIEAQGLFVVVTILPNEGEPEKGKKCTIIASTIQSTEKQRAESAVLETATRIKLRLSRKERTSGVAYLVSRNALGMLMPWEFLYVSYKDWHDLTEKEREKIMRKALIRIPSRRSIPKGCRPGSGLHPP